ncbi:similar to Saccharomyces cerevisiae YBR158W AMN1 Protein required for daughter cell separation, multiple mitotic checkpoints, and chromosome stability [Maudiozyma saulgeensis]|uniref:Similar to Saccharomyces cerevisiae YBR158W AMN1 Protein required for daughter cell separation, multiple mitotic checkpoints, and chromosome stability n=1 Tax=Maudiozyma saulgeensis TaxID=1789683 RepID=A0A1X7R662_9SACH|nr:similar to Saccharomyces cerevisiae YBR158W AMN1 Protein required for daughter cell separation, multiple mitotic checkpoints, and chromosome stability [Kazachstania saulgeensis]
MTPNDSTQFNKRSSENLFIADHFLQPPQKRHSIGCSISRSNSAPQQSSRSIRNYALKRSPSPIRLSRRHPYQYTGHKNSSSVTSLHTPVKNNNNHNDDTYRLPVLQVHTKHTSIDNGLPSPIPSPQKQFHHLPGEQLLVKQTLVNNFADLSLLPSINGQCHQIFKIPEIVEIIINNLYLMEFQQVNDIERVSSTRAISSSLSTSNDSIQQSHIIQRGTLHNCAKVNKLWHDISMKYLLRNLTFKDSNKLVNFMFNCTTLYKSNKNETNYPRSLTLYKLNHFKTEDLQLGFNPITQKNNNNIHFNDLQSLQFYICPNLLPIHSWFKEFRNLKRLSLPGNRKINDKFMIEISLHLENLEQLDLRACYNITDVGVVSIASRCKNLKMINLGRHKNGRSITDVSLVALGKYTNVETVGVAGCDITDSGLWEFAKSNGNNIKRLSLNNCKKIGNMSIPYLVSYNYFPELVVLEIRDLDNLTNIKPLIKFKLWKRTQNKPLLIESCNRISQLLKFEEEKMKKKRAIASLREMQQWINEDDEK